MDRVEWSEGTWLNPPPHLEEAGTSLDVTAAPGSDFWRKTYYGFERDSGHALLVDLLVGQSIEVDFHADFEALYDQAGLMLRANESRWIKTGVEVSDGMAQLGAVVTDRVSDWSCAPVSHWANRTVTLRVSRGPDAVIIRARTEDEPWRLVRLAPFVAEGPVAAGLFCASPERGGLVVRFTELRRGHTDAELHQNTSH